MKYRDVDSLYRAWKSKCVQAIEEVAPEVMKDKMSEAVEIEVYGRYSGTISRRGQSGGLADKSNYEYDLVVENNKIKIIMFNNTKGNSSYSSADAKHTYIDSIIVTGRGYTWKNSNMGRNPFPRDFYSKTEELLKDGEIIIKIKNKLKALGIKLV